MSKARAWWQAARPLLQVKFAVPILYGEALAFAATRRISLPLLLMAHLFGVLDQLFGVFANDVADYRTDAGNATFNEFSGGSRVIAEGKLTPMQLAQAALFMALSMGVVGALLSLRMHRPLSLVLISFAVLLMWAYSFAPFRLSYRGHGEVLRGLALGVLLPLFGYYLQTRDLDALPWLSFVPAFVLGYAGNVTVALPDYPSDLAASKRSFPVRYGQRAARIGSLVAIALGACCAPLVLPGAGPGLLVVVIALPLGVLWLNLRGVPDADADNHAACRRFVIVNEVAINVAMVAWVVALFALGR